MPKDKNPLIILDLDNVIMREDGVLAMADMNVACIACPTLEAAEALEAELCNKKIPVHVTAHYDDHRDMAFINVNRYETVMDALQTHYEIQEVNSTAEAKKQLAELLTGRKTKSGLEK